MKKAAIVLFFMWGCLTSVFAQGYVEHTVKEGESLLAIVEKYQVSPYELYELNPDAKEGLNPGMVLVFLRNKNYPYHPALIDLKFHKVKKKETLFGITQQYNVIESDLKKYNPDLYANSLTKGMELKIPVFDKDITAQAIPAVKTQEHVVQTKETKFGIAKLYQVSILELEAANPHIKEGIKVGQVLQIPNGQASEEAASVLSTAETEYLYYQVQPKEGFYRLEKKLGLSKDSLMALNPELAQGIKLGMLLKYPKKKVDTLENRPSFSLIDSLSNKTNQHITLLLPFMMDKIKVSDSISNAKKILTRENNALNKSIDFYSGVAMALDSLKQLGVSTKLEVLDTRFSTDTLTNRKRIEQLLNKPFQANEIVIGPLVSSNVKYAAQYLAHKNIPVVAPYEVKIPYSGTNLYQAEASTLQKEQKTIAFLKKYSVDKNVIVVAEAAMKDTVNLLQRELSVIKVIQPREGGLLIPEDIEKYLSKEKENVVVVESQTQGAVSTTISILDTFVKDYAISLFSVCSSKWFMSKNISNIYRSKLNMHIASTQRENTGEDLSLFIEKYKTQYKKLPNKYAIRGFDVTLDVVLRQLVMGNLEQGVSLLGKTDYTESSFEYLSLPEGGYRNSSVLILEYAEGLELREATTEKAELDSIEQ